MDEVAIPHFAGADKVRAQMEHQGSFKFAGVANGLALSFQQFSSFFDGQIPITRAGKQRIGKLERKLAQSEMEAIDVSTVTVKDEYAPEPAAKQAAQRYANKMQVGFRAGGQSAGHPQMMGRGAQPLQRQKEDIAGEGCLEPRGHRLTKN